MGYRDEGEAALQRVQNLEQRITEQQEENHALQDRLAQANAEIVRLRGQPIAAPHEPPVPKVNEVVLRVWLGVALAALVPLAVASYQSETKGMRTALLVVPIWGGLIAAFVARRNRPARFAVVGGVAVVLTLFLLIGFFATIWRSL